MGRWSGRVDVARALLEAGAKIDVADKTGRTPLTHAAEKGTADVVDLLRAQGATGSTRAIGRPAITARAAVERSLPLCNAVQRPGSNARDVRLATMCR